MTPILSTQLNAIMGHTPSLSEETLLCRIVVADLLKRLTARMGKRTSDIIALRYGLRGTTEATLQDIADIFSVTPERIRQIECRALRYLRQPNYWWGRKKNNLTRNREDEAGKQPKPPMTPTARPTTSSKLKWDGPPWSAHTPRLSQKTQPATPRPAIKSGCWGWDDEDMSLRIEPDLHEKNFFLLVYKRGVLTARSTYGPYKHRHEAFNVALAILNST